jgi:hypothetical protein
MSPDNGRPLHHLTQINSQRPVDGNNENIERSKSNSRIQVIDNVNFLIKFFFSIKESPCGYISTTTNTKVN